MSIEHEPPPAASHAARRPARPVRVQRRVAAREFCALLVSRRHLERADDYGPRTRGLYDPETATVWLVPEAELREALRAPDRHDGSALE